MLWSDENKALLFTLIVGLVSIMSKFNGVAFVVTCLVVPMVFALIDTFMPKFSQINSQDEVA